MYKVTWSIVTDKFKNCFAICNYESALSLYWNLVHGGSNDGCKAQDVKMWDLEGNQITDIGLSKFKGSYTNS